MRRTLLFLISIACTSVMTGCTSIEQTLRYAPKTYGSYIPVNKGIPQVPQSIKKPNNYSASKVEK